MNLIVRTSTPSKENRFLDEAQEASGSDNEDEDEVEEAEEDDETVCNLASDFDRPRLQHVQVTESMGFRLFGGETRRNS